MIAIVRKILILATLAAFGVFFGLVIGLAVRWPQ